MKTVADVRFVVACLSLASTLILAVTCFGSTIRNDSKCVQGVNPNTCDTTGNAMCAVVADEPPGLYMCEYCSGSSTMPATKYCIDLEGAKCKIVTFYQSPCSYNMQKRGTCVRGRCVDPMDTVKCDFAAIRACE
jgi:hypothetical protein